MDLGPTQSIKGGDVKLLLNLVILLGLSVTLLATVLAFHASVTPPDSTDNVEAVARPKAAPMSSIDQGAGSGRRPSLLRLF